MRPVAVDGVELKGIRERIEEDRARVAPDKPDEKRRQRSVLRCERDVRPDLVRRISQPHGDDVSSNDERVVYRGAKDRSVERIGERVCKERRQVRVRQLGCRRSDEAVDGGGDVGALGGGRTHARHRAARAGRARSDDL